MKLTKHDALAYLLMTVYLADEDKNGIWKSDKENALLEQIQKSEKVDLSFNVAKQFMDIVERKKGGFNLTAYKITGRCSRPWIVRVSGYMHIMAQASANKLGKLYDSKEWEECSKFDRHFNIDDEKEKPFHVTHDWLNK